MTADHKTAVTRKRVDQTCLESGVAHYIRHCSAVVQVEMGDEHEVHFIEVNQVKIWQGMLSRVPWVYATVQHDTLAPAARP